MNIKEQKALYLRANKAYNNTGASELTDAQFDKLEQAIRKADPEWQQLKKTGAKVDKKTEIALEFPMPSLAKCYPDKIDKWTAKQVPKLLIMDKLDGSALQLTYDKGVPARLVTRGDGTNGGDISFLLPYLNIPKRITIKTRIALRCEALMTKAVFESKYASEFENARNTVNGWLNRMTPHAGLADVDIVVLGMYGSPLLTGLRNAEVVGFKTVPALVEQFKPELLEQRRKKSKYDMDGLVLCDPNRIFEYENADKPRWTVAYKENLDAANATTATVVEIIWQDSMKSRLIPKIRIKPVRIGGTTVTFATLHNAKWMVDRKIGPGAIIKLVRSGDVIPKVVSVVKAGKLQLPTVPYTQKGVHFIALERSQEADVRAIHKFFTTLGIEFIARKTIDKMYDAGFTEVFHYLLEWGQGFDDQHEAVIGKAMTAKIYAEFDRVFKSGVTLRDLMVASNCFDAGIGGRKLKAVETHHGPEALTHLLSLPKEGANLMLSQVPGYADKTVALVLDGLPAFKAWYMKVKSYITVNKSVPVKIAKKGKFTGKLFSFTGYRSTDQEQYITDNGGEVVPFGSKTTILLYGGKMSTKVEKAVQRGITVTTFEELK